MLKVKKDFPIFEQVPGLVYLDNAATSQKPKQVIEAVSNFYLRYNSNIHRGIYTLSQEATNRVERSRGKVAKFVGADSPEEIIFTGNASEAINLVAFGYARKYLRAGDIIVLSEMEHHSNFVPWLRLRKETGIKLVFLPIGPDFSLNFNHLFSIKINFKKIKLVALTQASNVLGTINPIREIIKTYKRQGIEAKFLVDAAQSVPHIPIDIRSLGCDFLAFSAHKMLGPTGVGILWAKREILEEMDPMNVGSNMISSVTKDKAIWANLPDKFETGTGRLEAMAGLGAAIDYLNTVRMNNIAKHERLLTEYTLKELAKLKQVKLYGSRIADNRLGVFAFNLADIHAHDVGEILNRTQICVRTGHHCAQPLMTTLGVNATVRASLYLYNSKRDIDLLIEGLQKTLSIFNHG
jgi:cysteine desulfurase / selenocysteine lyase